MVDKYEILLKKNNIDYKKLAGQLDDELNQVYEGIILRKSKSFVIQASILASAGLITKVIVFVYRIPMANILGNTGNGIYSVAFGIYSIALTLSSYSVPVALSKLISEKSEDVVETKKILKITIILSSVLGLIMVFLLYFGAKSLAVQFGKPGLETPLRILAPTTFIVAVLGCFRGYFQGFGNMVPTAISQIAEQVINAVVSILAASQVTLIISSETKAELRAAGGTMGTFVGAFASLMIIVGWYIKMKSHKSEKLTIASDEAKIITKSLFFVMIPIILSQTVYQIGFTLDDLIFAKIMGAKGFDETYVTNIQGVFNTQYNQLINLPVGIATAFGVSVLPGISKAIANKNKVQADKNISELVKMNSLIVFPAAIGLSICSDEIMRVLFPTLGKLQPLAVNLICYGSIAAVFYSFSTISASILQGGNRFKVPVINSAISLFIHVVLVVVLLTKTNLQVYALLIGDIVFPLILLILNWIAVLKLARPKINFKQNVVKPLLGAVIMGLMVIIAKRILKNMEVGYLIKLILEVSVGGLSYILFVSKNKIAINKR